MVLSGLSCFNQSIWSQDRPLTHSSDSNRLAFSYSSLIKDVQYYRKEVSQIKDKLANTPADDARILRDQLSETELALQDTINRARTAQKEVQTLVNDFAPKAQGLGEAAVEALNNARAALDQASVVLDGKTVSAASPAAAAPAAAAAANPEQKKPEEPATQRTFVAIKPDGVQRRLIGEIVRRFENRGLKVIGLKLLKPNQDRVKQHYAEHEGKEFFNRIVTALSSRPVVALALEGVNAVAAVRAMCGATDPIAAAPGTIRGEFGLSISSNIVHSSDSPESGKREIAIWFKEDELVDWE